MIELAAMGSYYDRMQEALRCGIIDRNSMCMSGAVCKYIRTKHNARDIVGSSKYCGDGSGTKKCKGRCCVGTWRDRTEVQSRGCATCESPCPAVIEYLDDKGE